MTSPRTTLIASALGAIAVLGVIVLMATSILGEPAANNTSSAQPGTAGESTTLATDAANPADTNPAQGPDCPTPTVGGVTLDCLTGTTLKNTPNGTPGTGKVGDFDPALIGTATPTVVTLWAWWCGPCKQELPLFESLAAAHSTWNVVGVHADPNSGAGRALLKELDVTLPSVEDPSGYFAAAHTLPNVVPITLFITADGDVTIHAKPYTSLEQLTADATAALGN